MALTTVLRTNVLHCDTSGVFLQSGLSGVQLRHLAIQITTRNFVAFGLPPTLSPVTSTCHLLDPKSAPTQRASRLS